MNYFWPESKSAEKRKILGNHGNSNTKRAMILIKKFMICEKVNELFVTVNPFFWQKRQNQNTWCWVIQLLPSRVGSYGSRIFIDQKTVCLIKKMIPEKINRLFVTRKNFFEKSIITSTCPKLGIVGFQTLNIKIIK